MEHHYPLFFELILKNKPFKAGDISPSGKLTCIISDACPE